MSIIFFSIFFTALLVFGYLAIKSKWKIKHLAFLCFVSVFLFVFSIFLLILYMDGRYIQFFLDGEISLNSNAIDLFFVSGMSSFLATLLLIIVVWSVRNKVF
ncbi:hypothetical protein [Acinetobacter calcoaceticus]|uniref:hypothetical protein n=1 Tax=Acinetobacter calcoaceticus TaxID=471 RepID=UPI001902A81C|nr:hypothetical protein [Acinetobacter calcoaceticus]MBJ9705425.1 hypothetical protein [Acinetobacter calcoaceticus]